MLNKKIWANFQKVIKLFTQKLSPSSQKYGLGIRDPEKTYSGSRIQGEKILSYLLNRRQVATKCTRNSTARGTLLHTTLPLVPTVERLD